MAFFSRPSQSIYFSDVSKRNSTTTWVSIFLPTPHISPWTAWLTNDWLWQNIEAKELGNSQAICWYCICSIQFSECLYIPNWSDCCQMRFLTLLCSFTLYISLFASFDPEKPCEETVFILLNFFFLTDSCDPRSVNWLIAEKC